MIIVKYNGTQKNYHDADFLYILYYTHRYTSLLIRTGTSCRTNTGFISQMFSICTCVYVILYSKNYQLYHACNTILAFSSWGKKLKASRCL